MIITRFQVSVTQSLANKNQVRIADMVSLHQMAYRYAQSAGDVAQRVTASDSVGTRGCDGLSAYRQLVARVDNSANRLAVATS